MAESPNENPEKNMSFHLKSTNAIKVKQSIAALCDSDFNPQGVGMVEVTEKGFEIIVRNTKTLAVGNLFLNSSGLINFHCNYPIVGKMINLNQIFKILNDVTDDDTITVYHLGGSTHLSFILGNAPAEELKVEFLQNNVEFEKLPNFEFSCEAGLKSEILMEIIKKLNVKAGLQQLVSAHISEKKANIFVGRMSQPFRNIEDDEDFEGRVLTPERHHQAWFNLRHLESMKKASTVTPRFHLRFLTEPSRNIMMRFKLDELGDLVFIHKALRIIRIPEKLVSAEGPRLTPLSPISFRCWPIK